MSKEQSSAVMMLVMLGVLVVGGIGGWFAFYQYPTMYPSDPALAAQYDRCERVAGSSFRWSEYKRTLCGLNGLDALQQNN